MINDNTILSSFNDRPTLLEWLKKVEEALKTDTATGVSVENPSVNSYIFKITFADGKSISSDTIKFPDSVKGVSISNNHLIITTQGGIREDLGVINPYAETIVLNSVTNTTEIVNNLQLNGNLQVNSNAELRGNLLFGGSTISIQGMTKQNGILGTNADGKIAFKEISGGTQWYKHEISGSSFNITFICLHSENLKDDLWETGSYHPALISNIGGATIPSDASIVMPSIWVGGVEAEGGRRAKFTYLKNSSSGFSAANFEILLSKMTMEVVTAL